MWSNVLLKIRKLCVKTQLSLNTEPFLVKLVKRISRDKWLLEAVSTALWNWGWPWTSDSPSATSLVLKWLACSTMPASCNAEDRIQLFADAMQVLYLLFYLENLMGSQQILDQRRYHQNSAWLSPWSQIFWTMGDIFQLFLTNTVYGILPWYPKLNLWEFPTYYIFKCFISET